MRVEVIEPHGFCAGVKHALELVEEQLAGLADGERIYCLHEIVHNEIVVADLRRRGIVFVETLDEAPEGATVIFSAHGVSPAIRERAALRGLKTVDATCPFVAKVHKAAKAFAERGVRVVVIGRPEHAEVQGIMGEAPGSITVDRVGELQPGTKIAVVSQTTMNADEVAAKVEELKKSFDVETMAEVCNATKERQDAVKNFSGDAILVLGSGNSSNTRRLCEVAKCRAFRAGSMAEVRALELDGVVKLGVTAGASTPENFVKKAVEFLSPRRLFTGFKAGDLNEPMLKDALVHTLDVYHKHAIEKVFPKARVVCSPHLPEGEFEEIVFKTGPKLMSGELSLDIAQECARKGRFRLEFVGKERERNELLEKVKDRTDRSFRSVWPASVPGGRKLDFVSYPGCFCHRRLDEGGLALAEVVTRELSLNPQPSTINPLLSTLNSQLSLLDMGCGCGLVGLLIADYLREHGTAVRPTMIDSHTRAVEAAKENAAALGIDAEVLLADDGIDMRPDLAGAFDVFVGNPPYYSDYRIAEVFLATAAKALRSGGVCYTVCKNADGLKPVQEKFFPSVNVIKRRGYAVLKSIAN